MQRDRGKNRWRQTTQETNIQRQRERETTQETNTKRETERQRERQMETDNTRNKHTKAERDRPVDVIVGQGSDVRLKRLICVGREL